MELFASKLIHQLPAYFSYRPDPQAAETNAFLQVWLSKISYANPLWGLTLRVLLEISQQQAEVMIVASVWKSQFWHPILLSLPFDFPHLITSAPYQLTVQGVSSTSIPASGSTAGRMAHLKSFCQAEKFSKQTSELLLVSWRDKPTKANNSLFY